jgi:uncharacterized membrane protein
MINCFPKPEHARGHRFWPLFSCVKKSPQVTYSYNMEKRPILNLPYTTTETAVQITTAVLLLAAWGLAWHYHQTLPETIPIHFNFAGEADGYGEKGHIFALPAIATIVAIVLALLSKIPHQFNYLVAITEANAEKQYRGGRMLLFVICLGVAALSLWSVWKMGKG